MDKKENPYLARTIDEWKKYREIEEKEHPVRVFLRNTWYSFYRFCSNTKWFIKHRTTNRYHVVKTGLSPGWYDTDTKLLYVSFTMLKNFVEKEKPEETINWQSDESHSKAWKEIKDLYDWWTITRPNRIDSFNNVNEPIIDNWHEDKNYVEALHNAANVETERYEEDTENLVRLMKIRQYLWT